MSDGPQPITQGNSNTTLDRVFQNTDIPRDRVETYIRQHSLSDIASFLHKLSGDHPDFVSPTLLMTVSRTLGEFTIGSPILGPRLRPNLFEILIAPPEVHHKSTLINLENEITSVVKRETGDVRRMPSITFDGSREAILELLSQYPGIHIRSGEFGSVLQLDKNKNRYDSGKLILLNELYYGNEYTHNTRTGAFIVPDGRYVTLIAALHPAELTPEFLKSGLARRSLTVKLDFKDITPNAFSYDRDRARILRLARKAFIDLLAKARKKLFQAAVGGSSSVPKDFKPILIEIDDPAMKKLTSLSLESQRRVRDEESLPHPGENIELMVKVAMNLALWDYAKQDAELVIREKHIDEARAFLTKIAVNYAPEIAKIEYSDFDVRLKKLVSRVDTRYREHQIPVQRSTLLRAFQAWGLQTFDAVEKAAVESGQVKKYKVTPMSRGRPALHLWPSAVENEDIRNFYEGLVTKGLASAYYPL